MSSTPEEFLSFSISAQNTAGGIEFNYRNAASRAYYAAFHCCYAERLRCPNLIENEFLGSHDKLYAKFTALPITPVSTVLKSMAYVARMMKGIRHKADYRLGEEFALADSAQQISDAQSVHRKWKELGSLE